MSNIAGAGSYKAPSGIGSRNDGGGPGSGNSYAQFGDGENWDEEQEIQEPPELGGNPFKKLTYIPLAMHMANNTLKTVKRLAAQAAFKNAKKVVAESVDGLEEEYYEEDQ
jgi:hypothetical protein